MESEERVMRKALLLARLGVGRVEPNPMVGAIVVSGGRTVAYAHHALYGGAHAEAAALDQAGERARGGTLFVTLEPCAHTGKTPPCAERILEAGVTRVVYGAADPNPLAAGRGPELLRRAGVRVDGGVLGELSRELNRRFEAHLGSDLPWTIAKWAMTLDGKIADADGGSKYLTGERARRLVHEIRGAVDAVIVGIGTVRADDPELTPRGVPVVRDVVRVVVDSGLSLSPTSRLVAAAGAHPVWVATREDADPAREATLVEAGCRILRVPPGPGGVDMRALFVRLRAEGIGRVLLEGGGELHASALEAGVIHQVMGFVAPLLLGGRTARTPVEGAGFRRIGDPLRLQDVRTETLGPDLLIEGFTSPRR